MWLLIALISVFMQALVNYIDEYLTSNNKVPEDKDIHTKIGGLVLISTLMSFVGAFLMTLLPHDPVIDNKAKVLAITSAVPMVAMYISYFYLLVLYPINQVGPLFQITCLWLLLIEILFGGSVSLSGLIGIFLLIYGAYIMDTQTWRWKIPSKLLIYAVPATSAWAIALYQVRVASETSSPIAISYYQMASIGVIGVLLFLFVKKYRNGFLYRIKKQGKVFLGLSLINESLAEGSYMFANMAVAIAPVAAFMPAMTGVQSLFVLLLLFLFPLGERTKVKWIQVLAVLLIAAGVTLIGTV